MNRRRFFLPDCPDTGMINGVLCDAPGVTFRPLQAPN